MIFTIGQVAKMYDISHDTLRYYDKIGLLKPNVKKDNGYRYYSIREIELLEIILIAKQLEIPIKTIKTIVEKEDESAYANLFEKHEKLIEEKIKYLNSLKVKVKRSRDITKEMSEFKNKESIKKLKTEYIDKEVIFLNQNGNSYIGTLAEEKNLMILLSKDEDGNIIGDTSIIGVEIFKDDNFKFDNYTDYIKKKFKGEYIVVTRKDTFKNLEMYIEEILHKTIGKERLPKKLEVLLESMFILTKKDKENIYFAKLYIPKL